ncbi:redoxin domain-containing protein [Caviibacter abscessus]|uniref:redoxin domain-containing protein n=1 Tax=Caviibacter abscessus TaxID=1766719 RepID=UPI000834A5F6|nr:redoxin domain-containing protein [Caviibacter abscessus]
MKKVIKFFAIFLIIISCSNSKAECKGDCKLNNGKEVAKTIEEEYKTATLDMFKDNYAVYSAVWCPHCQAQYEHLQKIYDKYRDNYHILTVIAGTDTREYIKEFMTEKKYNFPIVYDESVDGNLNLASKLEIETIPAIYFNLNKLDITGISEKVYYEKYKNEIDQTARKQIENVIVLDKFGKEHKALSIVKPNSIIIYGAPWCSDCVKELERLYKIKGKRSLIYIIDSNKFTYKEYLSYVSNNKLNIDIYYTKTRMNDVKWIPTVSEVKNSKFLITFRPNNEYLVK